MKLTDTSFHHQHEIGDATARMLPAHATAGSERYYRESYVTLTHILDDLSRMSIATVKNKLKDKVVKVK